MSKENRDQRNRTITGIISQDVLLKFVAEHSLLQVQQLNTEILEALQLDKPDHPCHTTNTFHVHCGLQLNSKKFMIIFKNNHS